MPSPVIKLSNVCKKYNLYSNPADRLKEALHPLRKIYHKEFQALTDINIEIAQSQSVGIIGLNGSGKSTLLKIIAGITQCSSGHVTTRGKISALLELGSGFNPEFTGIENVYFQCSLQGFDKEQTSDLVPEIIAFAGIGNYINQPVKTYSSGMYVRLAFAVAITVDPDVLVIDEALAVGDSYFQAKCMRKIKSFLNSRKTLIFVSHDPGAVKSICDKTYLLHQGRVIDTGDPDKVFNYYNALIAEKQGTLGELDKEQARVRSGNKKIELTKVEILNSKGLSGETFISGEPISICIEGSVHQSIENPTIGIMIRDRMGNDIFGTNNNYLESFVGLVRKGEKFKAVYKMPLNLGPNTYNLTIAAHSEQTHIEQNYDWINNAVVFKLIPSRDLTFLGYCRLTPQFQFDTSISQK